MILAKAKARANETIIVQAKLTIVTYDRQNILIVQAATNHSLFCHFVSDELEKKFYKIGR